MKLNCDLGESLGPWSMGDDAAMMPLIDQANIACGFHASDPLTMSRTLELATAHPVEIGAHPGYPDLVGFGRRSLACSPEEVRTLVQYQVGALQGIAAQFNARVRYVKPHGALSNDMMRQPDLLRATCEAVAGLGQQQPLYLLLPVSCQHAEHAALARDYGITIMWEAFADRAYDDQGLLVSRRQPGAVHHNLTAIEYQARSFIEQGGVKSASGRWLDLPADSLCVHGDTRDALRAARTLYKLLRTGAS